MSEYQYYEFCRINKPLSLEVRKEMASLSSRAHVSTHGVSYVYNYGDFKGTPKQLLLKHFDVFFYINNYGTVNLIFKYLDEHVDVAKLKKFCLKNVIGCELHNKNVLLDVYINDEEGGGWAEGEGLLVDLLPLYDEIKNKDYRFLDLVLAIDDKLSNPKGTTLDSIINDPLLLSSAQKFFLNCTGVK